MRLLRCLTVLAAALPLALLPAAPGQAAPPKPSVYLALGDSVAYGTGAADPMTQGYVPLLAADLQGDGCGKGKGKAVGCRVQLVNLAQNGATTVSLIAEQLPEALRLIEARNSTRTPVDDVRLITITIGGNDVVDPVVNACLRGLGDCPATIAAQVAQVSTNYAFILSALRAAAGPDTTIAVTAYYNAIENTGCAINFATPLGRAVLEGNPREPGGAVLPGLPLVAAGFNDAIRQQAAAFGAVIVETAAVVDPEGETQPDCLHPNTKGHADIAEEVAARIGNPFRGRGKKH